MRILGVIETERILELNDGSVTFMSKAAIDTDGSGPLHGDPDAQADTSLHYNGEALNADIDKYVVVPPLIIAAVKAVVLGCQAFITNTKNGMATEAVVGDVGPHHKLGEISVACAGALGIDPNPITGGEDAHCVHYALKPGTAAIVGGKLYQLQPWNV